MDRWDLREGFEERLAGLGFDLVQIDWAGHARRPVIRLRVEHDPPDRPVSLDDCTRVSRHMESWLDAHADVPASYVLEVSSPGIERPLTRARDFERFSGSRVAVRLRDPLPGRPAHLEGRLLGTGPGDDGRRRVLLRLQGGDEVRVPRDSIVRARIVHEWRSA